MSIAKTVSLIVLGVAAAGGVGYLAYEYIQTKKERDLLQKQLNEIDALFQPMLPEKLSTAKLGNKEEQMTYLLRSGIMLGMTQDGVVQERVEKFLSEQEEALVLLGAELAKRDAQQPVTLLNMQQEVETIGEALQDNPVITKFYLGIQDLITTKDLPGEETMVTAANDAAAVTAVTA